jgi:hypothetical protein
MPGEPSMEESGRIDFALNGDVVELTWRGFISDKACGSAPSALARFLDGRSVTWAVFDAREVTGFAADARFVGGAILAALKERGVRRTWVVTNSSPIRMIGSTVALAVGLSIRFHDSREEPYKAIALERLKPVRR